MYSNVARDDEYKNRLADFIRREYGISIASIIAAKRGFYGETWEVSDKNDHYFLKLVYADECKQNYERSFAIVQHLCEHGINFISRIVRTRHAKLSTHFEGAVAGLFEWIEGENMESDETKAHEYQMLAKIYAVPIDSLDILHEDFSSKDLSEFRTLCATINNHQLVSLLETKREKIEYRAKRLDMFSKLCQNDKSGFVITHGDAGGNFIAGDGKYFIVDWDGVTFAPPERDAWVMCSQDWARNAFQSALKENSINYDLCHKRLAYYCYRFFFFYLNSLVNANSDAKAIESYIDGWISDSIRWADEVNT